MFLGAGAVLGAIALEEFFGWSAARGFSGHIGALFVIGGVRGHHCGLRGYSSGPGWTTDQSAAQNIHLRRRPRRRTQRNCSRAAPLGIFPIVLAWFVRTKAGPAITGGRAGENSTIGGTGRTLPRLGNRAGGITSTIGCQTIRPGQSPEPPSRCCRAVPWLIWCRHSKASPGHLQTRPARRCRRDQSRLAGTPGTCRRR